MVLKVRDGNEYYMVDNRYPTVRTWNNGMNGSMYTMMRKEQILSRLESRGYKYFAYKSLILKDFQNKAQSLILMIRKVLTKDVGYGTIRHNEKKDCYDTN